MITYIGIDPGLTGGIAMLVARARKYNIAVWDMPVLAAGTKNRKVLDLKEFTRIMRNEPVGKVVVGIEEQIAMPRQSSQSTAKIFLQLGQIQGTAYSLGYRMLPLIRSQIWKKEILHGMPKGGKEVSILYVQNKFPNVELVPEGSRKPRDGRADAICIAEYVMRRMT